MIKALFFDIFGTLVDWRSSIINCGRNLDVVREEDFNWELFAIKWRLKYNPILEKVNNLPGTLGNDIIYNKPMVQETYQELQKLVPLIKVDMTSALGVLITYQDNDGD